MQIARSLKIILLLLLPFFAISQSKNEKINNLHYKLKDVATEEQKMLVLNDIAIYYMESARDSSMFYNQKSITYAEKLDQPLWKARFLLIKAYLLQKEVNLALSLKLCNEVLAIANDAKNEKNFFIPKDDLIIETPSKFRMNLISNAFHQLGNTNSNAANEKKAIEYYKKSIFVQKENDSTYRSVTGAMNIGSIYSGSGQLDSAFIYATRALKNARITGYKDYAGTIRAVIGNVYFKKGVLDSAKY